MRWGLRVRECTVMGGSGLGYVPHPGPPYMYRPRGEEGVLWAEELRGWFIALGIPSTDIAMSPESTRVDA